ncbi:unnamed protein product [Oncorhynchus mykiss]|uniref:Uncharacterized protein n=1 Tax=Oncorhynchus mykiss TaxID=8022 RepID=A0A060W207_ONCMY|nr:unnamed protein product [Oncorhynchus mykiss]
MLIIYPGVPPLLRLQPRTQNQVHDHTDHPQGVTPLLELHLEENKAVSPGGRWTFTPGNLIISTVSRLPVSLHIDIAQYQWNDAVCLCALPETGVHSCTAALNPLLNPVAQKNTPSSPRAPVPMARLTASSSCTSSLPGQCTERSKRSSQPCCGGAAQDTEGRTVRKQCLTLRTLRWQDDHIPETLSLTTQVHSLDSPTRLRGSRMTSRCLRILCTNSMPQRLTTTTNTQSPESPPHTLDRPRSTSLTMATTTPTTLTTTSGISTMEVSWDLRITSAVLTSC